MLRRGSPDGGLRGFLYATGADGGKTIAAGQREFRNRGPRRSAWGLGTCRRSSFDQLERALENFIPSRSEAGDRRADPDIRLDADPLELTAVGVAHVVPRERDHDPWRRALSGPFAHQANCRELMALSQVAFTEKSPNQSLSEPSRNLPESTLSREPTLSSSPALCNAQAFEDMTTSAGLFGCGNARPCEERRTLGR